MVTIHLWLKQVMYKWKRIADRNDEQMKRYVCTSK